MAEVLIRIAGRGYRIGCDEGEENRVAALAARIDVEAARVQRSTGAIPEARLLVMSALLLADRLAEAERVATTGAEAAASARVAERIEALAARLEALAAEP
ncbi:MAG: cell division protein ZapA [Paracoccaceae bacterium]